MSKIDKIVEGTIKLITAKRYQLQEMSKTKRDIVDILEHNKIQIYNHLVNCYLWNTSDDYKKWQRELRSFAYNTYSLKGTNIYPSEKQLYKWCFEDWIIEIKKDVDIIVDEAYQDELRKSKKNKLIKPNYNANKLTSYMVEYIVWLNKNISDGNTITVKDVSDIVNELITRYKGE